MSSKFFRLLNNRLNTVRSLFVSRKRFVVEFLDSFGGIIRMAMDGSSGHNRCIWRTKIKLESKFVIQSEIMIAWLNQFFRNAIMSR